MSKRNKKDESYLFVLDGKFLEADSLIEIRGGTTEQEWETILKETVDMYCFMSVGRELGPTQMEQKDIRIFRRIKRTIEKLKVVDPMGMLNFDLDKMAKNNIEGVKEGWANYVRTMKIAQGNRENAKADVFVSNL